MTDTKKFIFIIITFKHKHFKELKKNEKKNCLWFIFIAWTNSEAFAVLFLELLMGLFLKLDAAILEPYFHLLLGELQIRCDLDASQPRQINTHLELLLKL